MSFLFDRVSSSARVLPRLDGRDFAVASAAGPYLFGDDGARYVDTAMGFGGTMLGHADPAVVEAATRAIRAGSLPAFSHAGEERAAEALARRLAPLERTVFTSSGSEAVHLAARIARIVTGRGRIAKMAAGFDGWLDDVAFGNVGTLEAAFADGQRPDNGRAVLLRFNDAADVDRLFAERGDIAAVLYEPVLANAACIMPAEGYLAHVEAVARRHGALLIADEVLMGFRLRSGLTSHAFGLDPDIATVGKAIGSGIPVSAVVGRTAVMDAYGRAGGLRGGTFSGNPMACAAVEATLPRLDAMDYPALRAAGDALRASIERAFAAAGLPVTTTGYGNVFGTWFSAAAPADYAQASALADAERSRALHGELRRRGVLAMPSPWGRIYTTFAHDAEAMDILHVAFAGTAEAMGRGGAAAAPAAA